MVEIKMDLLEEEMMKDNDCFVSVRVGDYQKLSRLSASRTFRFAQAGDRRYGKIDIFKRIGSTAISIDPLAENMRKVIVPLDNDNSIGFKVDVDADDKVKAQREKEREMDDVVAKTNAAKDYLSQHSLEFRLSEAMQALLRERPDNPAEFLSRHLLGSQHIGGVPIPPPKKATEKEDTVMKSAPAAKKEVSTVAKPMPALKNTTYVMAPSVGTWLAKPQPVKVHTEKTQSWKFRPSVGSWLMAPPAEEPEEPKPTRMVLQRGLLFGPTFHGRGVMLL